MFDYEQTQQPRFSPWMQFAILLVLTGVGLMIGVYLSLFIAQAYLHLPLIEAQNGLLKSSDANLLRTVQFVSTFFGMALPALIFARIVNRKPFSFIGFNSAISYKQIFIIIGIAIIGLILSGALSELNAMIPLSKSLEHSFKSMEDEYNKEVFALANMKTTQDYIVSLIIIALLPAIFEEMLFRGCLQPVMINITKNAFAGILITSILFSALHGSFYGFLPRLALGLILGYIYYYSKNIWLAITFHFLNNAFAVSELYTVSRKGLLTQQAMSDDTLPLYYLLIAVVALYFAFKIFKKESEVVISMHNLAE